MKTITLSEELAEILSVFEQANNENMIIQFADGRQFMLSAIDDFDMEIAQTCRNQKLMELLDQRARQAQTISLDEVKC
ncbi:MAG: hypothetical protein F6J86_29345 [Symploca sp. SIO1B1]|nr:hypothetical protein [Symploca sp. SIO1B1]